MEVNGFRSGFNYHASVGYKPIGKRSRVTLTHSCNSESHGGHVVSRSATAVTRRVGSGSGSAGPVWRVRQDSSTVSGSNRIHPIMRYEPHGLRLVSHTTAEGRRQLGGRGRGGGGVGNGSVRDGAVSGEDRDREPGTYAPGYRTGRRVAEWAAGGVGGRRSGRPAHMRMHAGGT